MANYTSRFVQLTDYLLIEYRYTSPISPERLNYTFTKIVDGHTGENQVLNQDSAIDVTGNVQERSVVRVAGGKYADLDKDQPVPYLAYDTQLSTSTVSITQVPYDTIVLHLLAGYNFEGIDGVIVYAKVVERSGKKLTLANTAFLKDSDFFEFNPRPIFLGDRLYDKFITVKILAPKLNNDIFYSLEGNPTQPDTLIAKITTNAQGLLRAAPLEITATEIANTTILKVDANRYKIYNPGNSKKVTLNQSDDYANLSAVIRASNDGDFYEYFASWDGGFIEDFIFNANSLPGNNFVVIHELRVIEQVGSSFQQTMRTQSIQEDAFDQPILFRPVIINAAHAISFSIEYTVRLYNKFDSSQVIRTASLTDFSPKTWGKRFQKIQLLNDTEPHKIYNKVVSGPVLQNEIFLNVAQEVVPFVTKVVPAFFDRTMITTSKDTVYLDQDGHLKSDKSTGTQTVFGQGDAGIVITPFDNFYKFTVLRTEAQPGAVPAPLDLGMNAVYYLAFIGDNGDKVRFQHQQDALIGDPTRGDLVFKVQGSEAENILKNASREFWITSRFDDGSETNIYQGKFFAVDERDAQKDNEDKIALSPSKVAEMDDKIRQLQEKNTQLTRDLQAAKTSTVATTAPAINTPGATQPVTSDGVKIPSNLKPATANQIKFSIPGTGASVATEQSSIVANIVPAGKVKTKVSDTSKGNS